MICEDCAKAEATHLVFDDNEVGFFFVCVDCINPKTDRSLSYEEIKRKFEW